MTYSNAGHPVFVALDTSKFNLWKTFPINPIDCAKKVKSYHYIVRYLVKTYRNSGMILMDYGVFAI
jgi:hypothetical protein